MKPEEKKEEEEFENNVNSVEAVLFASGKPMTVEEISKICKISSEEVLRALEYLKKRYETGTSLTLMEYNNAWKLTVREKYIGKVRKIVPHTELTKSLLETLAVIAWKAPVLQSDIIKIRTNKAYDHINELANQGFITKEKHGKTALLKLTKKFYDYFEIDETTDLSKILDKMQPKKKKPEVEFYGEKEDKKRIEIEEGKDKDKLENSKEREVKETEENKNENELRNDKEKIDKMSVDKEEEVSFSNIEEKKEENKEETKDEVRNFEEDKEQNYFSETEEENKEEI
ncbi:MAG: SMC-Scp complex subunit ScpB [Candidatus Woesearchaeota archaeon]